MRDYAKIGPKAWQGATFKVLRKKGPKALVVGLYLMSAPTSNMLGLYSLPVLYMAHETGLGPEGASEGLLDCIEAGFCSYDEDSEMVWVHEMAKYQIAEALSSGDKRCKGIQKDYDALPDNPFLSSWFDRYAGAYHLTKRRGKPEGEPQEDKGHTKPLRSQEQEQEKEQEQEQEQEQEGTNAPSLPTMAGAVCITLKAKGISSVNPSHPDLLALLQAGVDVGAFSVAASAAVERGKASFAYVLATVKGQAEDAKRLAIQAANAPPKAASRVDRQLETAAGLTGSVRRQPAKEIVDVDARVLPS